MSASLTIAVAVFVCSGVVAEPFWCVLLDTKDAEGHRVQFRYEARALDAKLRWTPGGGAPPLSLEAATKIAQEAALRQSPKATGVVWEEIRLLKNVCDWPSGRVVTWFWDFSVSPVVDPHADNWQQEPIVLPARDIVILLDGQVVQPTLLK